MTDNDAIEFTWNGEAMVPLPRYHNVCGQFVVGAVYLLQRVLKRSKRSHDHYFVLLRKGWEHLPEYLEPEFPSEEKLRSWLLIEAGYCHETRFVLASSEDALRFASYCAGLDVFSRIDIAGDVISIRKAMSQSVKEMGPKVFQESKQKVIDVYFKLTGIDLLTLDRNTQGAAA